MDIEFDLDGIYGIDGSKFDDKINNLTSFKC